jgi:glycosyltransferase involved in cell wall biosynthesis
MKIVLFCHPSFLGSQSMPRFAHMLEQAYLERGHQVRMWSPKAVSYALLPKSHFSKWFGYFDQYILFPLWVKIQLLKEPRDTLFVFCDQALGPWVPLVKYRPHVVHVHDLLALRSALGEIPENPTGKTGRLYQRFIRNGFRQARNFISISRNTREELHRVGNVAPDTSEVVYNGLNFPYVPLPAEERLAILRAADLPVTDRGFLLHLGGNTWYKNLTGLIHLYAVYARGTENPLPLWCVSPPPKAEQLAAMNEVPPQGEIRFFRGLDNRTLQAMYGHASVFLFPSLAEGFGWPLIESQACGTLVVTTDAPPMNEVAGPAACYLPLLTGPDALAAWATRGAQELNKLLALSPAEREQRVAQGMEWTTRFNAADAIEGYLAHYRKVLAAFGIQSENSKNSDPEAKNRTQ